VQGVVAFWLAVGAMVIAGGYFRFRSNEAKHETLRRIVEKTGQIDESQFKALFEPPPNPWLAPRPGPVGSTYRALRVLGTLVMFIALSVAAFFTIFALTGSHRGDVVLIGYASASVVLLVGAGLFFCSRFVLNPIVPGSADKPTA
jgi:hypothetical protein